MFSEAQVAPQVVERQLQANEDAIRDIASRLRAKAPRAVVTVARGSSDNAATYAKYLVETKVGILTSSAAPSVSSIYSAKPDLKDTLVVAISQSGRSPDLMTAIDIARHAGAFTLALVNAVESPLAQLADVVLPLHAGSEYSVAATKSCIAAMTAIAHLVATWSGDRMLREALERLPAQMKDAWSLDWSAATARLQAARDLYVIARGIGFGAAQEAALKFKETCALHAEAFSAAEVRHGPMALANKGFPVLVLSQDDETRPGIKDTINAFAAHGADVLLAGFEDSRALNLSSLAANPALQPILFLQSFYRMAEALSRARGLDPDNPPYLNKVTETF
ncbi:MAG: SIS domain-containing protein [Alphaproteobacteria bacterium]|nr:SIS domain-containing protein [Alphaproteobacteria bacterium]MDE2631039.1 SIS domain-containing protein [Alphaproteobacteria bacterium]